MLPKWQFWGVCRIDVLTIEAKMAAFDSCRYFSNSLLRNELQCEAALARRLL